MMQPSALQRHTACRSRYTYSTVHRNEHGRLSSRVPCRSRLHLPSVAASSAQRAEVAADSSHSAPTPRVVHTDQAGVVPREHAAEWWVPSRPWLPSPGTPGFIRTLQLAAQMLQQRLPNGRTDHSAAMAPPQQLPAVQEQLLQQLATRLASLPPVATADNAAHAVEATVKPPLGNGVGPVLQQLRHQLTDQQWALFSANVQAAAAAALASSAAPTTFATAAASSAGSHHVPYNQEQVLHSGAPGQQQQHVVLEPLHILHDNHPVPILASLASFEEDQLGAPPLLTSFHSLEEEFCDALGEVHGYGRSCSTPDALSAYHPGYGPLHQELIEEAEALMYPELHPGMLSSTWYGSTSSGSWADPHTSAGWRRHEQHQQQLQKQLRLQEEGQAADGSTAAAAVDADDSGALMRELTGRHHITVIQHPAYGVPASELPAAAAAGTAMPSASPVSAAAVATAAPSSQRSSSSIAAPAEVAQPQAAAASGSTSRVASSGGSSDSKHGFKQYEHLVFGGGGARCLAYAGALHSLRQLGLVGRLKSVSGASGGAVYALLAALGLSIQEVLEAMSALPDHEPISWWQLNNRLGLTDGEATFTAIHNAIASKLGIPNPTLGDVAAATGVTIALTATSLARRAPVYLRSDTHAHMPVMQALRGSCAIPLLFAPVRSPEGDLLVDGCITDCTPVGGLGPGVDPARVLVLAVHDASGLESPDLTGLVTGLVATCMQAGYHHIKALGVDVINLWPSVAAVNPLQFRVPREQARDVVAKSQALAEAFAVERMSQQVSGSEGAAPGSTAPLESPAVTAAAPGDLVTQVAQQSSISLPAVNTSANPAHQQQQLLQQAGHQGAALLQAMSTGVGAADVVQLERQQAVVVEDAAGELGVRIADHWWDESVLHW